MSDQLTLDRLLGGRVLLRQPAHGYRVAIDPVLLAAAVPAVAGERVLDAGAGTGAAALCLAVRVPGCKVVGIELQPTLQQIAAANVMQNDLGERVEMLVGDLIQPPRFAWGSFDHVMTNPPHLAAPAASAPPLAERAMAHVEGAAPLPLWLQSCIRMLRPGGMLTLIHRAERVGEIFVALGDALGGLVVFPLWPGGPQRPAKRAVLVQGCKGTRAPLALLPGLVLHEADGRLSAAAEAVLRHGEALVLAPWPRRRAKRCLTFAPGSEGCARDRRRCRSCG